jgi:hypothetical protein
MAAGQLTVGEYLYSKHFAAINTAKPINIFTRSFFFFFFLYLDLDFLLFVRNSSDSELELFKLKGRNSLDNVFFAE